MLLNFRVIFEISEYISDEISSNRHHEHVRVEKKLNRRFWVISESWTIERRVNYVWWYTSAQRKFLRFSLINDLGETEIEIEHEKSSDQVPDDSSILLSSPLDRCPSQLRTLDDIVLRSACFYSIT